MSVSTLWQLCDDASNSVLIEINEGANKWAVTRSGASSQSCRSISADA